MEAGRLACFEVASQKLAGLSLMSSGQTEENDEIRNVSVEIGRAVLANGGDYTPAKRLGWQSQDCCTKWVANATVLVTDS